MFRCRMTPARVARLLPLLVTCRRSAKRRLAAQPGLRTAHAATPAPATSQRGATPPNAVPPPPPVVVEATARARRAPARRRAPRRRAARTTSPASSRQGRRRRPSPPCPRPPVEGVYATPSPIKERYQLPQTASAHRREDRADHQRGRYRGRGQIPAEPVRAQTQLRRQPGGAGHAHLGAQLQRAHADLCRRHSALEPASATTTATPRRAGAWSRRRRSSASISSTGRSPRCIRATRSAACCRSPPGCRTSSSSTSSRPRRSRPSAYYNTSDTYRTDQTSVSFGNRWNDLSVFVSGNYPEQLQPAAQLDHDRGTPAGTTGAIPQLNRTDTAANVIGAGGLLHTEQANLKGKFVLDITRGCTATYTVGFFVERPEVACAELSARRAGNPTYRRRRRSAGRDLPAPTTTCPAAPRQRASAQDRHARRLDGEMVVTATITSRTSSAIRSPSRRRGSASPMSARSRGSTAPTGRRATPRASGARRTGGRTR